MLTRERIEQMMKKQWKVAQRLFWLFSIIRPQLRENKNISSVKIDLSETSFYENCYLLDQNETNSDFLASEQSQGSLLPEIELLCLDCDASRF